MFELSRVWPTRWPLEATPYMVFFGPVFHNTKKTNLKGIGHCGCDWVCGFAVDMSKQTHCMIFRKKEKHIPLDIKKQPVLIIASQVTDRWPTGAPHAPHRAYLSLEIMAMNSWKTKCVCMRKIWVSNPAFICLCKRLTYWTVLLNTGRYGWGQTKLTMNIY